MSEHVSVTPPTPRQSAWITAILILMVALPATLTLSTVEQPGVLKIDGTDPTPYGYTVSLLLFIVPILTVAGWLLPQDHLKVPRRAFWWTVGLLFPLGAGLDFFFAHLFFVFPNAKATLGIHAPALRGWVPIEEYIFYLTGFVAVLLVYVWLCEYWMVAYSVRTTPVRPKNGRLVKFHLPTFLVGIVLIVAGIVFKKFFSADPSGFPGYFTFLVLMAFIPGVTLFPVAQPRINWRAFAVTFFFMLLISLMWEATLGVPYGWWGYQSKQMLGIFIGAWSSLPLEAVLVWLAVTYTTAIFYEVVKLFHLSGESIWTALFGTRDAV
jgi:hypothetical protein